MPIEVNSVEINPDQDFENLPSVAEKFANKPKIAKKSLIVFVSIFGIFLLSLLALVIFLSFNQKNVNPPAENKPTPTPTMEIKEEITTPSLYATDAAILKTEEEIKNLDQELQNADLKETNLNPPNLDWQIEFEK
ncbi:MAG: hypothetical protein NT052_00755 [Candidatus Shapirobacteria bacterium]|nr:hypothetical protein [Candidatus Shapirobacteria bacterium]